MSPDEKTEKKKKQDNEKQEEKRRETRKCWQNVEIKEDMGCGRGTKPGKESLCMGVATSQSAPTPAPSTTYLISFFHES